MVAALALRGLAPTSKLVLVALGSWWNPSKSDECWPGLQRLQDDTGLSRRSVQRALRELEAARLITTRETVNGSNRYALTLPNLAETLEKLSTGLSTGGVTVTRGGVTVTPGGVTVTRGGRHSDARSGYRSDHFTINDLPARDLAARAAALGIETAGLTHGQLVTAINEATR